MKKAILATKVGMTQIFNEDGTLTPVDESLVSSLLELLSGVLVLVNRPEDRNYFLLMYTSQCCGMIAVKREVAAFVAGVPWSECQVRKLTTSYLAGIFRKSIRQSRHKRIFCVICPLILS